MGNQASSPAPCFDDQVYTTLSWADGKETCRTLFEDCQDKKKREGSPQKILSQDSSLRSPQLSKEILNDPLAVTTLLSPPSPQDELPALTDRISSPEPSSTDEDEHDHFRTAITSRRRPARQQQQQQVNVIALHYPEPVLSPTRSAEYYLGLGAVSSNDDTHGTSGSFNRDARADLGTSRGSSVQGRESFDEFDEYRTDVSERIQPRE